MATFLVRHGEYYENPLSGDGPQLPIGREKIRSTGEQLTEKGLARNTIILCSRSQRTSEAGYLLAQILQADMILSDILFERGLNPGEIESPTRFIEAIYQESSVDIAGYNNTVIVTHGPLIDSLINHIDSKNPVVNIAAGTFHELIIPPPGVGQVESNNK